MVILSETKDGIDVKTVGMHFLMHCFADVVRVPAMWMYFFCLVSRECMRLFNLNIFEKKSGVLSLITL